MWAGFVIGIMLLWGLGVGECGGYGLYIGLRNVCKIMVF